MAAKRPRLALTKKLFIKSFVGRNSMKTFIACSLLISGAFLARSADLTIPVEKYQLKNGLRVVLSKDTAVPVVTVYMIYDVGSRSEEKGRTGFAHLFEHMMFE